MVDQKETNSKPAKSRSDGKWTFNWDHDTTSGGQNLLSLTRLARDGRTSIFLRT